MQSTLAGLLALTAMTLCTAGDRFISVRPGYQIVKNQLAAARFPIAVEKFALAYAGRLHAARRDRARDHHHRILRSSAPRMIFFVYFEYFVYFV
jgi:hypothetical protein